MMRFLNTFTAAFLLLTTTPGLRAGEADKRLDIYWVDVEGGAATLIVTPAGESVLIDAGNPGGRDAPRVHKVAAEVAKLKKIDHLVVTHFHRDHFGGAAELAALMPIGAAYDNGEFPGGRERPDKAYLEFKADRRVVLNPGDEVPLKQADGAGKVALRCLAARKQFVAPPAGAKENLDAGKKKPEDFSDNANSIVQLLSLGDFQFFDGGDLTWNMEARLVSPVNLPGPVDVMQINHHGLDVSNNPLLCRALAPRVVIMNNGPTKGCGPETFATLKSLDQLESIYQLHKNLRPDGDKNNVADEFIANQPGTDACQGNYVKVSVDPAGKSYTVSVPSTKHEQAYQAR